MYGVRLTRDADEDLRRIGEPTEKWLIGELFRLPRIPASEFKAISPKGAKPEKLRWRIGAFVVVFYERPRTGIAVVERVIRRRDLDNWLAREAQRAKHRDDEIDRSTDDRDD